MITTVYINSIDVTSLVKSYSMTKTFGDELSEMQINLSYAASTLVTIDNGLLVQIYRGDITGLEYYIFKGYIDKVELNGSIYNITAKDMLNELKKREITYSYDMDIDPSAGVISEIFKDMINNYTDLVADATSVVDTGGTVVIVRFVCNHAEIYDRADNLAKIMDYQIFYKPDTNLVYFQPKGYTNSSTILTVGDNIVKRPRWDYNNMECINDLTIIGAEQETGYTQYFSGSGSTTSFLLSKIPKTVKIWVDNVLKTQGVLNSTSGVYDYTVDAEKKTIIFQTAPIAGLSNIKVDYTYLIPVPIKVRDPDSINKYGTYQKTIFKNDFKNVSDAEQFANGMLAKYKEPFVMSTLSVSNALALEPGQTVQVVDNINNENRQIFISRINIKWPYNYDEVEVGDKIWKTGDWNATNEERVRRLEEYASKNQDIIVAVYAFNRNIDYQRRDFTIEVNGTPTYIEQGNRIYREFFTDKKYCDLVYTTANWDLSQKELVF